MKIAGIVAEYNPFHRGHEYQIAETRRQTGAEYVIAVMSGDFVQRGAPAVFDKYFRTEAALLGGADLVLELPAVYACASAEFFASGAVSLLHALGCVSLLSFGSERGEADAFLLPARVLENEPEEFRGYLREALKGGCSFPRARAEALRKYLGADSGALLASPNNILAVEYCRALLRLHSPIVPFTVKRAGKGYHESGLSDGFASASGIRRVLIPGGVTLELLEQLPPQVRALCVRAAEAGMQEPDDYSLPLACRLLDAEPGQLARYPDISEALAQRIYKNRFSCRSLSSFVSLLKTKDSTYAGISRALLRMLLNIEEAPLLPCPYARILGFRRDASPLLSRLKRDSWIPLISKAADAAQLLSPQAAAVFAHDVSAANLYETVRCFKTGQDFRHELRRSVVIV